MRHWFAVQTQPHAEETASRHLHRQGFQPYLPRIGRTIRHARRSQFVLRPLFPGYLFVHLDPESCRWRAVNSTVGVAHLLVDGHGPLTVPGEVIEAIRAREDDGGLVQLDDPLQPGDPVTLGAGPFLDVSGLFQGVNETCRVNVLLHVLGRPVQVTVPREWIRS